MLNFNTAWSPPLEWLQNIVGLYTGLAFRLEWAEGGMGFSGEYEVNEKGEVEHESSWGTADTAVGRKLLGEEYFDESDPD